MQEIHTGAPYYWIKKTNKTPIRSCRVRCCWQSVHRYLHRRSGYLRGRLFVDMWLYAWQNGRGEGKDGDERTSRQLRPIASAHACHIRKLQAFPVDLGWAIWHWNKRKMEACELPGPSILPSHMTSSALFPFARSRLVTFTWSAGYVNFRSNYFISHFLSPMTWNASGSKNKQYLSYRRTWWFLHVKRIHDS